MPGIAFNSLLTAFLPVGFLSFAMTWWALKRGYLTEKDGFDALAREIKAFGKQQKKERKKLDPLQAKWLKFGGGFYGLVGLYTYAVVEWREVAGFLGELPRLLSGVDIGALVNLAIEFFVDSLVNFITAVTWPVYWLDVAPGRYFWLWVALAYAGYWLGMTLAQKRFFRLAPGCGEGS